MFGDFQSPPMKWLLLTQIGGFATAGGLVWALQTWDQQLTPQPIVASVNQAFAQVRPAQIAQWDQASLQQPQQPPMLLEADSRIGPDQIQGPLSASEQAMAQRAWRYFDANWQESTGLVNRVDRIAVTSLHDMATSLAALVSARELALISDRIFQHKLKRLLQTLATLPLYNGELPHRLYHTQTALPLAKHPRTGQSSTGWSAIDIGRLARWLKIVGARYPQFKPQTEAIWQRWQVSLLTRNGQLMASQIRHGREQLYQQGRLGYETYAAYGLRLWGLPVDVALQPQKYMTISHVYGQPVPTDRRRRNFDNDVSVNSDPYILDGIETGFQALPRSLAEAVLRAQMARFEKTQQLTAVATDAIDRAPFRLTNTVIADQKPWSTYAGSQQYADFRFLSTKAAVGWYVLYPNHYTRRLVEFVQSELGGEQGWQSGFYETLRQPNQALSADTNGVILASLLYRKVDQPLMDWAGIRPVTQPTSDGS
ncbi:DUF3131 domain-containing protein [filamentous cyanobacterium LEGE 11480]|uniref:DUF3131 domain-containing protein n=1 Tax=Romeriopsis navalis LEGE 11480 TaxID=2777977 RepID=A0A928VNL5_9CYAN|nr:DUF3131 domain-containing protein [Romeriopsis navalis]MBE9029800.1 DUF3131 domain-containing protein [Romeriopsis navalis LEGE 11480]